MTNELVVDVQPKEVSIALLEDKSLVELQSEGRNISFSVGNMYLGRIKKLMPGLNACFVDVGYEKDAFLHYLDLGPQFNSLEKFVKQTLSDKKKLTSISKATLLPDLDKDGTVSNTLKVGQEVVVQIVKEPISTKGPRLTSEISFAGRYLVLIPFNDKVSVSDINKTYSKCNNDATEYPYSKMISQFGCVEGYSCFVKDKSKSRNVSPRFYVGYELESDKFKVLYPSQFQSFLEKNYTTTDMFIRDCAGVVVILMQLNKLNGKLYLTSYSNIKDGTLFGKKAVLKETFKYETYEVRCYSVCDFEVYCLC